MSSLKTAARAKVLKGGRLLATRSERKKADVEGQVEQARTKVDIWNARAEELGDRATELEKQLEHSALQDPVAESKYSLFYDETQTLK